MRLGLWPLVEGAMSPYTISMRRCLAVALASLVAVLSPGFSGYQAAAQTLSAASSAPGMATASAGAAAAGGAGLGASAPGVMPVALAGGLQTSALLAAPAVSLSAAFAAASASSGSSGTPASPSAEAASAAASPAAAATPSVPAEAQDGGRDAPSSVAASEAPQRPAGSSAAADRSVASGGLAQAHRKMERGSWRMAEWFFRRHSQETTAGRESALIAEPGNESPVRTPSAGLLAAAPEDGRRSSASGVPAPIQSTERSADEEPKVFTPLNVAIMSGGAVVMGAICPYLLLKAGIGPSVNMLSGLISFTMLRYVARRRIDAREINLLQAAMTMGGNVSYQAVVLVAMGFLGIAVSPIMSVLWLTTAGWLGTLAVVLARHQVIEVEKLPFPTGTATAAMLTTLADPHGSGARQAKALGLSAVFSGVFSVLRDGLGLIPGKIANGYMLGAEPSLMLLGAGALIGGRTAAWMLLSSLLTWGVLAPGLVSSGVAGATAQVFGLQDALARGSYFDVVMRWTMWPATILMVSHGLMKMLLDWRSLRDAFGSLKRAAKSGVGRARDLSLRTLLIGMAALTAALVLIQYRYMGYGLASSAMTLLAVAIGFPLLFVGVRAVGETTMNPVSTLGALTQLVFALIAPGNIAANMTASGLVTSQANAGGDASDDYKTGYILGNKPRSITLTQLLGVPIGAVMATLMYHFLNATYGFEGAKALPAPESRRWEGLARLLSDGGSLPRGAAWAMLAAGAAGVALAALEKFGARLTAATATRAPVLSRAFSAIGLPSAMAVGMAMFLPGTTVMTIAIGAALAGILGARWPKQITPLLAPISAGFIAAEALAAIAMGLLRSIF